MRTQIVLLKTPYKVKYSTKTTVCDKGRVRTPVSRRDSSPLATVITTLLVQTFLLQSLHLYFAILTMSLQKHLSIQHIEHKLFVQQHSSKVFILKHQYFVIHITLSSRILFLLVRSAFEPINIVMDQAKCNCNTLSHNR